MFDKKTLEKYAHLVLSVGVNIQKGQGLELACPVEKREVAEAFAEVAYSLGASIVRIRWEDEIIDKINYQNANEEVLTKIPKWFVDSKNYLVENNFCYVAIASDNPIIFKDIPAEKLSNIAKARSRALKKFSDVVMENGIRWCVVSVPTPEWAKQVFPDSKTPEQDLANAIIKTMRLDCDNPTLEWKKHIERLEKRAEFLNFNDFESLRFNSKNGTDLTVGLAENHTWLSAKERAKDGVSFVANMPTEEVFTAPHRDKVDGVLFSTMPLCENGQIIDEFSIKFKKGKIVDFTAKKGYDVLKHLIETDEGTKRLGEVALIGKNSPIAKTKTLFFNTLFDENASCHLAIGKAYPTTIKEGEKLTKNQLKKLGANDSIEHIDFMIGSQDLSVIGIKKNKKQIQLFSDGEWCI